MVQLKQQTSVAPLPRGEFKLKWVGRVAATSAPRVASYVPLAGGVHVFFSALRQLALARVQLLESTKALTSAKAQALLDACVAHIDAEQALETLTHQYKVVSRKSDDTEELRNQIAAAESDAAKKHAAIDFSVF